MLALKKLHTLIILIALSSAATQAQTSMLKGCITDAGHSPLAGVNVILMSPSDSSIVLGSITTPNGLFEIKAAAPKKYILSLSMIGYKKQYINISTKPNATVSIDTIALTEDAKMLAGATIQGKKNAMEFEAGKTIVSPNASIITSQGNILDVLKNIPGLIVNDDGSIVLNGKKGITVQINGKTTFMTGTALLNQLQSLTASSVDQVEVITTPTAQYDASGKAGVINIKVQKQQILGKSLSANLNYRQNDRAYGDFWTRGTVQNEKAGYFAEYFKAYGNRGQHINLERIYDTDLYSAPNAESDPDSQSEPIIVPQYIESVYEDASNFVKFGGDVDLSKKVSMNAYVSGNFYRRHIPGMSIASYSRKDSDVDSLQNTQSNSFFRQTTLNAGIGLDYHGERNQTADIAIDLQKYKYNESIRQYSSMLSHTYNTNRLDTLQGNILDNIQMAAIQGNYSMPLSKSIKLESGIKASYVDIGNTANYSNPIGTPNYNLNSKYLYTENNNAAYLQASGSTKQIRFSLGIRAENTRIDGKACAISATGTDSSYKIRYTKLFPSVSIQYKQSENSAFSLAYNRRITRPDYNDLSPFSQTYDRNTISKGNPKLKAELTDNIDLSYSFLKAFRISLQASNTDHAIIQYVQRLNNSGFQTYPENLGSSRTFGIKADAARIVNLKWWYVATSLSLSNIKNEWEELGKTRVLSHTTFNGAGNSQFIFGKGWSGQISGYYNSEMVYGQYMLKAFGTVSAGMQKSLWDNRATVKVVFNDIFSTKRYSVDFDTPTIAGNRRKRDDDTYVNISISCNLKSGTMKNKKGRDTTIEESKRIKNRSGL